MRLEAVSAGDPSACPYCGSNLIWDYVRGEVVCPSCGTVVDVVYDCGPPHMQVQEEHRRERARVKVVRLRDLRTLERKARVEGRKELSLAVVRNLPPSIKEACEHGIKVAEEVSPTLVCGKTLRAKYAVGYIIHAILTGGVIDEELATRTFRLSPSSVRRLVRSVEERMQRKSPNNEEAKDIQMKEEPDLLPVLKNEAPSCKLRCRRGRRLPIKGAVNFP